MIRDVLLTNNEYSLN